MNKLESGFDEPSTQGRELMFTQVSHMNEVFGKTRGSAIGESFIAKLLSQTGDADRGNIYDELAELGEAYFNDDKVEILDALCDILVYTMGAAHLAGFNLLGAMSEVYRSNMSKLCADKDVMYATMTKYSNLRVAIKVVGDYPQVSIRSRHDQTGNDGVFYPADKFLKSVSYSPPDLKPFLGSLSQNTADVAE